MKSLIGLSTFALLCFAKSAVSYQIITLSSTTLSEHTYKATVPIASQCDLTDIKTNALIADYRSLVSCPSSSSHEVPTYYEFDYDESTQSFTSVFDSFGNHGFCQLTSDASSTSRTFDCNIPDAVTTTSAKVLAASVASDCNAERQKCIKVCDKGSRSPACYRNCTALYKECESKPPVKNCNSERQKCIKVCDKGSRSPACYRNCTALYNKCNSKKTTVSNKKLVATNPLPTGQCDTERQKCINVCGKGSRSPACYRNCTALYNECQAKPPVKDCNSERQKCITVCDKGSRSPACYRNCTALYNKCNSKKLVAANPLPTGQCNAERQKCINVCDKGSRSPACYRHCTALYNECQSKPPVKDCNSERQKCIKVCDKGSRSPACYRNCTALYNKCEGESNKVLVEKVTAKAAPTDQCDTNKQTCIKVCDNGSKSPACYSNCTFVYNECKEKKTETPVSTKCDERKEQCIEVCSKGSKSPACYRNCTALYNQCKNKPGSSKQAFVSFIQ